MRQNTVRNYSVTKGNTVSVGGGGGENYYRIQRQYIPTAALLYPFAAIALQSMFRVPCFDNLLYGTVGVFSYSFFLFVYLDSLISMFSI
jgi:hypothetical protein